MSAVPSPDEIRSEFQRLAERMEELKREYEAQTTPPPPPPTAKQRARAKGWLLGIPALAAPFALFRSHTAATLALAGTAAALMITPSFSPREELYPTQPWPPRAAPTQVEARPPQPAPPRETRTQEAEPTQQPSTTTDPPDTPDVTATPTTSQAAPSAPAPADTPPPSSGPDGRDGEPSPEPPPPPQEPPSQEPDCTIVRVDADVVEVCLLPE